MGVSGVLLLYFCNMFIRKKINKSGSTSIAVVDKSHGRYRVVKTFGSSSDLKKIEQLESEARQWMQDGQMFIPFEEEERQGLLEHIDSVLLNGPQLLLGKVYDEIGFSAIQDAVLRELVISRICHPASKLSTKEFIRRHFGDNISEDRIYRYMDKLYNTRKEIVQRISVGHTAKVVGEVACLLFYDVTTLYFESSIRDGLRENGFSKDGKTAETQIVLGLLASRNGYPLSYSIFNGSQFEGRTMLPVIDDFIQRFKVQDFVIVADSGLMSAANVRLLQDAGYKYILGARIKNAGKSETEWILSQPKQEHVFYEKLQEDGRRLIIGYSSQRAKKDRYNREKGLKRLRKAFASGHFTKENINKRGYNKFLELDGRIGVRINEDKIGEDAQWDGLKGYVTNTSLSAQDVVDQYHGLWVVERAFRVTKGNFEMRPIFHFTPRRIEAHICICFIALKVYKELERQIKAFDCPFSVDTVLAIANTITTIYVRTNNGGLISKTLFLTEEQKSIQFLF